MRVESLSHDPLVHRILDFLSNDEAEHLVSLALPRLVRSTVVGRTPGARDVHPSRTSETAYLPRTPVTEAIQARAKAYARLSTCELLQVVSYTRGQEFRPHLDQFDPRTSSGAEEIRRGGQRRATFLIYLACPAEGGATVFPELRLEVQPVQRSAVFWTHQNARGETDPRTLHGGAPVTCGRKLAVNLWLR